VLHRDLKPQNIMVGQFGEVLVMDWGLAKVLEGGTPAAAAPVRPPRAASEHNTVESDGAEVDTAEADTEHGVILGTPGYMAPEQARGEVDAVGPWSDVYSLGAVLKFLVEGPSPTPKALAAIVLKAMAQDVPRRYASVEELASDIAHYVDGLPVSAYPEGPMARMRRWAVKNRAWILLIVAYLVMRALFIVWRGR
jgi:eukaryotic-like serine/threonine-protein kinase